MGDRYILNLDCAYCGVNNVEVYYAPTCGLTNFKCKECGKVNCIHMHIDFMARTYKQECSEKARLGTKYYDNS